LTPPDDVRSISTRRGSTTDDGARIDAYLRGDGRVFAEVEGWIRTEMRHRYPGLAAEHEDLCQVVHEKLLGNLRSGRFEGRSALRTYVIGIAHHAAIDRVREIRRQRDLLGSYFREPVAVPDPGRTAADVDEVKLLHRAVLATPSSCRQLWKLVFIEKLNYDEIGRRLAIPPGTVKSRMWHCRRKAMAVLSRLRRRRRGAVGLNRARERTT
jgi:RNA polymerase sigma-70 factor (ECF subfamily)